MRRRILILLPLLLCLCVVGLAIFKAHQALTKLMMIQPGMSEDEMVSLLGMPDEVSAMDGPNLGDRRKISYSLYRRWPYRFETWARYASDGTDRWVIEGTELQYEFKPEVIRTE
jgi:hypothetical protein